MSRMRHEQAISLALRDLGDIEIEILSAIVQRLAMGQKQYGVFLRNDPRNMKREVMEEVLDAMVYSAFELIKLVGNGSAH